MARAYGAQCTPDFFGFNGQDELQYRGRLDASRMTLVPNARRDLFEAMKQVAETGHGPAKSNALNGMLDQVEGLREMLQRQCHVRAASRVPFIRRVLNTIYGTIGLGASFETVSAPMGRGNRQR